MSNTEHAQIAKCDAIHTDEREGLAVSHSETRTQAHTRPSNPPPAIHAGLF